MVSKLVKKTAKELAGQFHGHQDVLKDNRVTRTAKFLEIYPDVDGFVAEQWPKFVPAARAILAEMMTHPGRSQREKDEIYDALIEDHGLRNQDDPAPSILRIH